MRPHRLLRLGLLASSLAALAACDTSTGGPDAGVDAGSDTCTTDEECDDLLYCNGVERCDPSSPEAHARGCAHGTAPCPSPRCDEAEESCAPICPDADGDSALDAACGGDDCDDADAQSYPGNTEVCDTADRDEDCDPSTLGPDLDADGQISDRCCNRASDGLRCGEDCDDEAGGVFHGSGPDGCDGADSDCDGAIDEDPTLRFYRDIDGDGYGVTADSVAACSAPPGYGVLGGDCDDTLRGVNPSVPEICNGRDDDCDGETDVGCPCTLGSSMLCGVTDVGDCVYGVATCVMGPDIAVWGECVGASGPEDETCSGGDEDCDGLTDEDTAVDASTFYFDGDGDGHGRDAVTFVGCDRPTMYSEDGGDCDDTASDIHPGAIETCDGRDQSCNGVVDDGLPTVNTCRDRDGDGYYPSAPSDCAPRCAATPGYTSVGGDCADTIPEAFPGQTAYFGGAYCTRDAGYAMFANPGWLCPAGIDDPRPSWDYDCDGSEVVMAGSPTETCPMACGAACADLPVYDGSTRPVCGSLVPFTGCSCLGGFMGCSLLASSHTRPLPCR